MAQKLTVGFMDINGVSGRTSFWCNDAITAAQALQSLANLSNAQIVSAFMVEEYDLVAIGADQFATAANVETVLQKALVRMSGPDAGSVAAKRSTALLSIPAPIGTIVDGLEGDTAGLLVVPFIGLIVTDSDVVTDRIDRVFYER